MAIYMEENGNIYNENHEEVWEGFKEGDVLLLENMPFDLWDESTWSFIHATGVAIYTGRGWSNQYENENIA